MGLVFFMERKGCRVMVGGRFWGELGERYYIFENFCVLKSVRLILGIKFIIRDFGGW